jgi:two-component sensor histidine kinase
LFNQEVIASDTNKFLQHTVETTKEIVLSYRENVFSFSFAALNMIHPENNHYAYMLENFDKDWNYTNASKRFANYTNIDAGTYIFKVKGSNNDGVWNETPATIRIIITPPFWKTLWFRILVGLVAISFVYSLYRYRLYQVIRLQNIRNKIAGDLHDEIGSTLNSISVFSEVARNKSKKELPELKMIGEASRRVIDAMSDIVWTITPENDSFEKIIFRMRSLTHSLMKAKKIEYSFRADETLNELKLPMMTRKNFYLIFKEALNNLVKYSNATRASVTLAHTGQQIELLIRDNGIGFDMNNISRGNGLNNMNRRAAEMKAQFEIQSSVNAGTSVQLLLTKKSKS